MVWYTQVENSYLVSVVRKSHPYLAIPNGLVIAHHWFLLKKSLAQWHDWLQDMVVGVWENSYLYNFTLYNFPIFITLRTLLSIL